jgi:hypothetical protein
MTRIVQHRRGTTSSLSTILGAPGELFVDTSLVTVVVHDGVTTGGVTLARNADVQTLSSVTASNLTTVSSNINTVSSNLYSVIFAPKTLTTKQTLVGSTTSIGVKLAGAIEHVSVSSVASTGTINFDLTTQACIFNTLSATNNWTLNFRGNVSSSLDSILATGESISAAFLNNNGATAYYNNAMTIDSNSVTPKWQNGVTPTFGNTNSTDIYSFIIVKTGSAAFTVFATISKFA